MKTLFFGLIAFTMLLAPGASAVDGTFAVKETWMVTTKDTNSGTRKTYSGTATGYLVVENNVYTLIDKTGIPGFVDTDNEFEINEVGGGYEIVGDYPLEAVGGDERGIFVIVHLSFFTIAIRPGTFNFNSIFPGSSTEFTTTGTSLTALSASGFANSSTQMSAKSTSSLRPSSGPPETAPRVTLPPKTRGVLLGRDVDFSVLATGTPPPTYQWVHDGIALVEGGRISGTTTARLTIDNVVVGDGGRYTAVVSNSKGSVTSAAAMLVIGARVTVQIDGAGSVSPDYDGESFALGTTRTMTARPAAGQLFKNWTDDSGNVLSEKPALSFTFENNFPVTAHFEPNRFIPAAGTYLGSFSDGSELTRTSSGFVNITVVSTGAYTGKLTLAGGTYAFSGALDLNGDAAISVGKPPVPVVLHLDLDSQSSVGRYAITGTVGGATFRAHHSAYAKGRTLFEAGKYTLLLEATAASDTVPAGTGYATLTVSSSGAAKATGKLADGTALTLSGSVTGSETGRNECLFRNATLYASKGLLAGTLTFGPPPDSTGTAVLHWIKPLQSSGNYYRAGFSTDLTVSGARYRPPEIGTRALDFFDTQDNGVVELSGGSLLDALGQPLTIARTATLSATNIVTISGANPEQLKITINAAAGTFSGSFKHPIGGTKTSFGGLLQQQRDEPRAAGYFLGPVTSAAGLSGKVSLDPSP